MPLVGCETADDGGTGGTAGAGGGGDGGSGGTDLCEGVVCDDDRNECTVDGECDPADGICDYAPVEDGAMCEAGACQSGVCEPLTSIFPCTEQGIRDAIEEGGGPHGFACDGRQTVTTLDTIDLDNDVILDGEGKLTVDANDSHPVFVGGSAELRRFRVVNGRAISSKVDLGGGIIAEDKLMLVGCTISGNTADAGGGIVVSGSVVLINSTVSDNTAAVLGGGILVMDGTVTLINSTVSGNTATSNGTGTTGSGGGVFVARGTVTLINSTVSGNTADEGGGILGGTVTLINSTIARNTADEGSALLLLGGDVKVRNTLIDGECSRVVISGGYNIESPGDTCGFDETKGDKFDVSAMELDLGRLADNGGPTATHGLLLGSVAIDQIPAEDCVDAEGAPLTTDQRGEERPVAILGPEPKCDVGAFEWGGVNAECGIVCPNEALQAMCIDEYTDCVETGGDPSDCFRIRQIDCSI